ncbi:MAG: hypothetical protein WD883_00535 [Candidatus Colwellbacteria bacterium]
MRGEIDKNSIQFMSLRLFTIASKPMLTDNYWQAYGYAKVPKRGSMWSKLLPKTFELEDYIYESLLMMGSVDVLMRINKANMPKEDKVLIALMLLDSIFDTTAHMFPFDSFMDKTLRVYNMHLKGGKLKEVYGPVILEAKKDLSNKSFAKFLVGTIQLFSHSENQKNFLIKSDYITDLIEGGPRKVGGSKLNWSAPEEKIQQYKKILDREVFNG